MTLKYSFKTAIRGLEINKLRSVLTILGIVIGITSIILIMSLGRGAQDLILSQVKALGSKLIAVVPGRQPKGMMDAISVMFADSLKEKDLDAIEKKNNVPYAKRVMPVVFGGETIVFENETYRPTILGATDFAAQIYDIYPSQGRFFSDDETKGYADVVVIGDRVREELFGKKDALGERVKIKGRNFRVVGIIGKKGQMSFINFDDVAIVPYTTAQRYIFGIKYFHRFAIEADSEANVSRTVEDVKTTLRNSHNITDPEKDDFFVETQAEAVDSVKTITNVFTFFLAAVAAISLIVGGVGIMNIMLVSVTERTREIGLRKALGATHGDILNQFLLEAITLTAAGGIAGILLGNFLSFLVALVLGKILALSWAYSFSIFSAVLGIGVSGIVGLVFGLYPARQAAKKSPMEALRHE